MTSSDEFDSTMPVTPPTVNRRIKPRAQRIGGLSRGSRAPARVASQLNTLIPVGTAMTIVAPVK